MTITLHSEPAMLRLLADEDGHGDIVAGLRRRQPALDVVRVQNVGLRHWCVLFLLQRLVRRLPLADTELIQRLVDFRMDLAKVRPVHVATLEEVDQVPHELRAEIVLRNVALDQRPHLAEQPRASTPTHDHDPGQPHGVCRRTTDSAYVAIDQIA